MTKHHEEWEKRVKEDPFADEPFTEEHKRQVIQAVQRISQTPAPKKKNVWLRRILPSVAVCSTLIAAVWWFLPGTELTPSQPEMISMSEAGPSTESTAESTDSEPYAMTQKETNRNATPPEERADSLLKEEQSKLRFSDQELWLQDRVNEADLIAELKITNLNQDELGLQADVEKILISHVNEVPSALKINLSETVNLTTIPLETEDRVLLFLKKTEKLDTYHLAGEAQSIYVVSADNLVSSIGSTPNSLAMEEIPYDEFIENIKALEDQ
ncbi:hypothetical protein QPK24_01870 [Paenibacillus polygoni]|uniref:DUF4367 domain-containing protein n=1 Tax=Paenibacillus polygoni TaxID=3050112 RepID=A0ABY8X7S7_9BACL|nr:hypothetical protein [Paenibacillus polygoni]WIV19526.1 hypothetical protein QPK24_01870 [Paenibacillus polygoni]